MALTDYLKSAMQKANATSGNSTSASDRVANWIQKLYGGRGNSPYVEFVGSDAYTDASEPLDAGRFINSQSILKRFHFGNEWGSESSNAIFGPGHEDPTHLTFKVEFGEWGGSISEINTIRNIQNQSYTTNVFQANYDDFPMGLMDLNFQDSGSAYFSSTKTYNAHNYLLQRNLDRRAQMLKDFVEGLYTIQKDFPYLFNKITGVSKLMDTDVTLGQRLKSDTTIQLTCLSDGIDQKMFHLMHLYRSAAWNDIYQRWELPDIYRYFKMIIYIYDNRLLQMGNGEWSTEQDDFPILALECSPCEFVISSHLEPEYSADAFESKNNSPTIDIKVRNLRVFWANGLMQRVQYVWELQKPSDFTELYDGAGEVYDGAGSLASATNWRFEWMKRMFMLPDEYGVYSYDVNPAATTHYFSDYNDMMHPDTLRPDAAILDLPIDSTWHRATVSDEAYVIRNFKDLWGAFKSIITSNTTLIRDSRVPDRYYFRNDLMRLDYRTYEYYVRHNYAQIDVEGMHNAVRMRILNLLNQLKDFGIVDTGKPGSQQEMTPIINNTEKQEGVIQYGLVGEDIPDQELIPLVLDTTHPEMSLIEIDKNLRQLVQEYITLQMNLDKPSQDMNQIEMNLDKPSAELIEIIKNLAKPDMKMNTIEMNLDKLNQSLNEIIMNLKLPEMNMFKIQENLSQLEQNLVELFMNLMKPKQAMNQIVPNLTKHIQDLRWIIQNLDKRKLDMVDIVKNLDKGDMELIPLKFNLSKSIQELVSIIMNLVKGNQELVGIAPYLDKNEQELAEIIKNLEHQSQELIDIIIDTHKLPQELQEQILNLSKQKQKLQEIIANNSKSKMEMPEINQNTDKGDMIMPEISQNTDKTKMEMSDIAKNTDKASQEMPEINQNTDKMNMSMPDIMENNDHYTSDMTPIDNNDAHLQMSEMSPIIENLTIPNQTMTEQVVNTDKPEQPEMSPIKMNLDKPDINMSPISENLNKPEITMTEIEQNLDLIDQQMTQIDNYVPNQHPVKQTELVETGPVVYKMEKQPQNLDKVDMTMPEIDRNVDKVDMTMPEITSRDKQPDMNMPNIDMRVDKPGAEMAEQIKYLDKQELTMPEINTEVKQNEQTMTPLEVNNDKYNKISDVKLSGSDKLADMEMPEIKENKYEPQFINVKLQEPVTPKDMAMTKLQDSNKLEDMEMKKLQDSVIPEEMKMQKIQDTEVVSEMKMQELQETEIVSEMKMQELQDTEIVTEMKMQNIQDTEVVTEMKMQELQETELPEDMKMQNIQDTEVVTEMKMQELQETEIVSEMKMQEIQEGETEKFDSEERRKTLDTAKIIENEENMSEILKQKLKTLTSIDTESLKTASMENLVKLVGMMEDTLQQVQTHMQMPVIKPQTKTVNNMQMPVIKQAARNQFLVKMHKVDEAALDRAANAQERARNKNKRH